jgi:nitroreductase
MDALENIFTRHSISKLRPDPVSKQLIEKLLAAAVQAPNHYKVRPWRFVVLQGAARERLGAVFAEAAHKKQPDFPIEIFEKERTKPLRAPVLIAVGVDLPEDPRVVEMENICAAAAAAENLLLAAHALGLAGMWRTGSSAYQDEVKEFLGFTPQQHLIAFLYIGYPAVEPPTEPRPGYEDHTIWMD